MDSLRHVSPLTPEDVLKVLPGLFWDHDCVMLPGMGGFVCNPRSAWYDEAKRQIVPPSRDVLFNPRLTTNDGVLANELMAKHGILYPDAIQAVEGLVQCIQDALNAGQPFQLPGLGKLYKEEDGQLRFMADAEFERMLRSFGHASIPLVARAISAPVAAPVVAPQPAEATPTPVSNPAPRRQPEPEGRVIPLRVKLGRAAAADVAATLIANAVDVDHPAIERSPASKEDDQTELGERLVTVNVGDLDAESLEVALKRGMNEAKRMLDAGLIIAAVLVLKNEIRTVGDVPAALMKTAN